MLKKNILLPLIMASIASFGATNAFADYIIREQINGFTKKVSAGNEGSASSTSNGSGNQSSAAALSSSSSSVALSSSSSSSSLATQECGYAQSGVSATYFGAIVDYPQSAWNPSSSMAYSVEIYWQGKPMGNKAVLYDPSSSISTPVILGGYSYTGKGNLQHTYSGVKRYIYYHTVCRTPI